ncbi:hypothetical protein HAX54_039823 [Datura stramonium]|uniref:Uncharacterized protein n=1 Tax=Datura stramonium TaxID=4076 RepID=A0ABS8VQI1_DATST|nr:hypothetical protein [Datura stramonium]
MSLPASVGKFLEQIEMELASKVGDAVNKALNSNKVLNVVLLGAFGLLCARSVQQQRNMETLEAEKNSLLNSNKAMKKAMWDWKQQLFAEAALPDALLPLSKIKAIYGEVQTTTSSGFKFRQRQKPTWLAKMFDTCAGGRTMALYIEYFSEKVVGFDPEISDFEQAKTKIMSKYLVDASISDKEILAERPPLWPQSKG